ncbi:MAG: anti-sigma factor family protein [Bryobacteraceae bacterium]
MNCAKWREWAALSAGGDLAEAEVRILAEHAAGCAACREFASELAVSQAMLRDLRNGAPDAAEYVRLRQGVMRGLSAPRAVRWWPYAVAAGLMMTISGGYWEIGRDRSLTVAARNPNPVVAAVVAPAVAPVVVTEPRPSANSPRRRHKIIQVKVRPAPPLVVKLATDDPEVTIIWLIDQKGDGE